MRTLPVILADAAHRDLSGLWVVFAVLAVSGLLLYYILRCLKSRRVWLCSKFFSRYYYRDEQPGLFWVMRVFVSPVLLFGAVASFFVFRGARWARITMGVMALLITVLITWYSLETEWDELSVPVVILSLTSLALLFIPTHEPVA